MRGTARLRRIARAMRSPGLSVRTFLEKHLARARIADLSQRVGPGLTIIEELPIQPSYPVDVVYTWVDDKDPEFLASLNSHLPPGRRNRTTTSSARFKSHDELRYSLRSLHAYAPWVNKIFIVTNGQRPAWALNHPKLQFVHHDQILEADYLPTFNSHVIESALHKIPGLSEHYIYFNDDVLLLRPLEITRAFTVAGKSYAYISQDRLVGGAATDFETATEWAGKHARDLIERQWGLLFDRRFSHMFHAQRRSVAEACERLFPEAYDTMRRNRFRQMNDVLCCSFLHYYVGYIQGETLFRTERGHYISVRSKQAPGEFSNLLAARGESDGLHVMCLNDYEPPGGGLSNYEETLGRFLDEYYPAPSPYEEAVR